MAGGQVWIPVNASMKGFASTVAQEAAKAAGVGGKTLETEFGKAGARSGQAVADGLSTSAAKVDAASRALATARKAEVTAANDVAIAEERLNQLRESGRASAAEIVRAETNLETAKAKSAAASERVTARETDLKSVRDGGEATSRQLVRAEDQLNDSRVRQAKAAGDVRAAEVKVEEARETVERTASRVAAAEKNLADVRAEFGEGSREAVTAERDLERAKKESDRASIDLVKSEGDLRKSKSDLASADDDAASKALLHAGVQEDLERSHKAAAAAADDQADKLGRFALSAEDADRAAGDLERVNKGLEVGFMAAGAAVVGAGAALVSVGTQFDEAYDTIRVGTGATGDALEGLKASALAVADSVPAMDGGITQISSTLADLNTRLGLTGEPLETMTSQFVQLSNMGIDADIGKVTQALSGFGIEAEAAPAALDQLFQISQATGLSVSDLADSAVKAGPSLREFGFGLGESAALVGQLDKAGLDADKTLASMSRAMVQFAKDGKDAPAALNDTVSKVDELIASGKDMEAIDLASSIFGTRGAGQFVDAVKSGTLSVEDLVAATGATGDTILGVAAETADFAEQWQLFKQKAMNAIEPIATALFNQLGPALEVAVEKFESMVEWISENESLVKGLAVTLGVMAATMGTAKLAIAGVELAMRAKNVALLLTSGGWAALNTAMKGNVIVLVATALAGLVAGLVYFFTQTETGRELWSRFTESLAVGWEWLAGKLSAGWTWLRESVFDPFMALATGTLLPSLSAAWSGIRDGWDFMVGAFQWGYDNIFRPVFDGLVTVGKVTAAVVMTAVLAPMLTAWNLLSDGIRWGWDNLIRPAWEAAAAAGSWLWNSVLKPVFDGISAGWSMLSDGIRWYWQNVVMAAWSAMQSAATWMWTNVLAPVFGYITAGWQAVGDGVRWVYDSIIKPTWDALASALTWLYEKVVAPTLQFIRDRWDDMANALHAGYVWVKDTVFGGLSSALDVLKESFRKGVDGIRELWRGIRRATAEPVEFVIKVFNEGVVAAWNKVAGWVDLPTVEEYRPDWLGSYAEGTSRVPGARTPYDNVHMMTPDGKFGLSLRGGEGVVVPEVVDALGEHRIDAMNAAAKTGGRRGVEKYLGGFAGGGVIGSIVGLVNRFFPGMTITSTMRPGDPGHHGRGEAVDFSDGYDTTPGMQAAARFFHDKYGAGLAELIHYPLNGWVNIKNGSPLDYGPATNAEHRNHVHIASRVPLPDPDGDISSYLEQAAAGGSGGGFSLSGMVRSAWDAIIGKLPKWEGGGTIGALPGAFLKGAAGMAWDFVKERIPFFGGGGGGDVEQWRDLARSALSRHGYNPDDHIDAMLEQIRIESSGDPTAVNNWDINAVNGTPSGGLLQVIEPTYRDVRRRYPQAFEGLPDDRMNPATNLVAGVGAVRRDWGGPAGRWPTTGGYDSGGWLNPGTTIVQNDTGKPEPVFNPAQWAILRNGLSAVADLADPLTEWVDRGIDELERMANAAEAGFRSWASGEADGKTRMGTPGEWGAHFGGMALESTADDLLGLVGMGGFVGGKLNDHTVGLLNAIGATFGLGSTSGDVLSAPRLLDDDGRVLQASTTASVAAPAPTSSPESLTSTGNSGGVGGVGGGSTTVIELEGGRVYAAEDLEQLNGKVDGLEVRVKKVEDDQTASTTSTLSFL